MDSYLTDSILMFLCLNSICACLRVDRDHSQLRIEINTQNLDRMRTNNSANLFSSGEPRIAARYRIRRVAGSCRFVCPTGLLCLPSPTSPLSFFINLIRGQGRLRMEDATLFLLGYCIMLSVNNTELFSFRCGGWRICL